MILAPWTYPGYLVTFAKTTTFQTTNFSRFRPLIQWRDLGIVPWDWSIVIKAWNQEGRHHHLFRTRSPWSDKISMILIFRYQ